MSELTLRSSFVPTENEFQTLQVIARNAASSGLYAGVGSEPKIFMVLLAARELGIPPMTALNGGIWNIQGKIEISARLMNSMIRKSGHSITIKHCDATKCILEGKRADNGDIMTVQFSEEDAKRAGLMGRTNWKSYAEDMLYARAMSRLARRLFPDVIGTAYVEGEIREAKYEVIEKEKMIETNEIDIKQQVKEFLSQFTEEDRDQMEEYLRRYSIHWDISMSEAINRYSDIDKFIKDFQKWIKKQQGE